MSVVSRLGLCRSKARLLAGDADRDRVADELARHCAAGRLTTDELSQRLDVTLRARTLGELAYVTRDLPPLPTATWPRRRRWRLPAAIAAGLTLFMFAVLGAGFVELLSQEPLGAMLAVLTLLGGALLAVAALGSLLATLAPLILLAVGVRWIGRRLAGS